MLLLVLCGKVLDSRTAREISVRKEWGYRVLDSLLQMAPTDTPQDTSEAKNHDDSISGRKYLSNGKSTTRNGKEKCVINDAADTKVREGEQDVLYMLEQKLPCSLWRTPQGSRLSAHSIWRTMYEQISTLQPMVDTLS